jgi:putative ABC transport system permease protein
LGRNWWGPSSYASFKKVIKGSDNQGFIILFLILTVSLGIYSTTIARTINGNEENRIIYSTGADVVLQEEWESNEDELQAYISSMEAMGQDVSIFSLDIVYEEPDFNRYKDLEGTEKATRVLVNDDIEVYLENGKIGATLMGINTKEFGETAYFQTELMEEHWYTYLNAIAQDENGILVSSNFRDLYGYQVGDMISFYDSKNSTRGKICGFIDYWPSYQPVVKEVDEDGIVKETPQFLIVANISEVQSVWGITPYQIWIRVKDSSSYLYDFAESNQITYEEFNDLSAEIIEKNNNPIFQGTNGILTLGFIIILLICAVGFLIFWIMSIFSRALQFGVYRAMGLTFTEIIGMLMQEQFFLSVIPILFGIWIGNTASRLFVPLIQIAYTSSEQIIPIEVIQQQSDQIRILIIVGFMVIFCMLVISRLISGLKITQALKLGED